MFYILLYTHSLDQAKDVLDVTKSIVALGSIRVLVSFTYSSLEEKRRGASKQGEGEDLENIKKLISGARNKLED